MALSLDQVQENRLRAAHHAQIEVLSQPDNPATPKRLQVTVRVCRVFRGTEKLQIGDRMELLLPVARKADMIAPGQPPLLNCVGSGFALIDAPTSGSSS